MTTTRKWGTQGTFTTAIAGAAVAPTLKNLANAGQKIGGEIDNSSNRYIYADWDLLCRFASAPSAGGYVALYLIPAVDGTNYTDGDDSVAPPVNLLIATFPVRAVSTAQRVSAIGLRLPNGKFKPLVINVSGQAMTNTDNENVLSYRPYYETAE